MPPLTDGVTTAVRTTGAVDEVAGPIELKVTGFGETVSVVTVVAAVTVADEMPVEPAKVVSPPYVAVNTWLPGTVVCEATTVRVATPETSVAVPSSLPGRVAVPGP
jgi:hypothetical protein